MAFRGRAGQATRVEGDSSAATHRWNSTKPLTLFSYHSGYEAGTTEGPYDPANATRGADTLIDSVETNGIGRNANVYAELGSTWRLVMRDPTTAAHLLGKPSNSAEDRPHRHA